MQPLQRSAAIHLFLQVHVNTSGVGRHKMLPDFQTMGEAAANRLVDRQLHFTSAVIIPVGGDVVSGHVATGTTLGYVCLLATSKLLTPGHRNLSDVIKLRWKAHKGLVTGIILSASETGDVLITAGADHRVCSWQLHEEGAVQLVEAHLPADGDGHKASIASGFHSPCLAGGSGFALCGTGGGHLASIRLVRSVFPLLLYFPLLLSFPRIVMMHILHPPHRLQLVSNNARHMSERMQVDICL